MKIINDEIFKIIVLRFILTILNYIDKSFISGAEIDDIKYCIKKILKSEDKNILYEKNE